MAAAPRNVVGGVFIGWGTALPEKVLTNDDLSKMMDTNDEWITERTGIKRRHVGGSTASLSIEAGRKAITMAGVDPSTIDALILSTSTPDRMVPATAPSVQHGLGLRCGAFDVNAACSGFMYATIAAHGLLAIGAKRILVIGTDTLSRITNWSDRSTAILFADGSGAAIIDAVEGQGQLLGWDFDSDGSLEPLLYTEHGGYITMDGKEVFRRAVRIMVDSAEKSLAAAGVQEARRRDGPHRCGAARDGQHVIGIHPARTFRCRRCRAARRRRSRPARRFRCGHDRGEHRSALARSATRHPTKG
jgi:3-oxoacyl-[acyl-carrier-protein] synthase-3